MRERRQKKTINRSKFPVLPKRGWSLYICADISIDIPGRVNLARLRMLLSQTLKSLVGRLFSRNHALHQPVVKLVTFAHPRSRDRSVTGPAKVSGMGPGDHLAPLQDNVSETPASDPGKLNQVLIFTGPRLRNQYCQATRFG